MAEGLDGKCLPPCYLLHFFEAAEKSGELAKKFTIQLMEVIDNRGGHHSLMTCNLVMARLFHDRN